MRPDCEHLSLCVGVQAALGGSLCAPLPRVTGLCSGVRSLGVIVPDLEQWWDNVTWSGCEIWGLVCSGVCGQGYQTCLCQLGLPVWDPGRGVHTC